MKKFSAVQGRVNTNRMIQSSRPGQDSTPAAESQDLNQEQAAEWIQSANLQKRGELILCGK